MVEGEVSDYARCVDNKCRSRQRGLFTHRDKTKNVLFHKSAFMQHIKNHHSKSAPGLKEQIAVACLDLLINVGMPATLFEDRGRNSTFQPDRNIQRKPSAILRPLAQGRRNGHIRSCNFAGTRYPAIQTSFAARSHPAKISGAFNRESEEMIEYPRKASRLIYIFRIFILRPFFYFSLESVVSSSIMIYRIYL